MKRSIIALTVLTVLSSTAANATNRDVNSFITKIENAAAQPTRSDLYNEAVNAFDNLNARDRMVVAGYADMMPHPGMIADVIGSAEARGHQANVPAGWKPELTRKQIADAHRPAHGTKAASVRSAAVGTGAPVATGTTPTAGVPVNTVNPISTAIVSITKATDAKLATKVDKTDYAADQQKQDKRDTDQEAQIDANKKNLNTLNDGVIVVGDKVNDEVRDRKAADDALGQRIDTKADQSALDAETAERKNADNRLAVDMIKHDQAQQKLIDSNKAEFDDHVSLQQKRDQGQDNAIAAEAKARDTADQQHTADIASNKTAIADRATKAELASGLSQKVDNSTFAQRSTVVDTRFADTDARIAQQKADQQKVNKAVAGRLDNHEGRIADLERNSNKGFAELKNQVEKNAKKANAGTSTALAAAGIPQVTGDQRFTVGAATGGYEGEQALAVGFSARISSNVTVKASVGTDTQHGVGYNAGVAVGW